MTARRNYRKTDLKAAAARLRANPGEWGHVSTYPASYSAASRAAFVRSGSPPFDPPGTFETRTVQVEDGTAVEARFVPAGGAA